MRKSQVALGSRSCRPRADFPRAQNTGWRICIVASGAPSLTTTVRSGADGVAFVPLIIPARPRPAAYSTRPPASVPGSQPRRWRRSRPRVFIIMSSTTWALVSLGSAMADLPALALTALSASIRSHMSCRTGQPRTAQSWTATDVVSSGQGIRSQTTMDA